MKEFYYGTKYQLVEEIWLPIKGYENLYEVSNFGQVKSKITHNGIKDKILIGGINSDGYHYVALHRLNERKNLLRHRLVAIHFLSNPNGYEQVNHKDCNKNNNRYWNLEWCTQSENIRHGYTNERFIKAINILKQYNRLHCSKRVYCNELKMEFPSTMEVQRQLKICNSSISMCCSGKRKSAGKSIINGELVNLTWCYIDKDTSL